VCTDVPAGLTMRLDRRRFDVIIANLVGNALRHGGPPVTVTARGEPHGRGSAQLTVEVREGSGLGLAIASENARLHGGRIEAGNHPGGGALFTVTLPPAATVQCAE
jgi:two-component system, OmpR family, sensor histidine kinase MtrB